MSIVTLEWQKRRAELSTTAGRFSLVVDRLHTIDADEEGRVLRAILGPSTWRRSYADRWTEIRSEALEGERFHVPYPVRPHEALSTVLRVKSLVMDARDAARRQNETESVALLDRVLAWEEDLLADDGARFRRIYPQLGPLPPDQQTALVLQPRDDFAAHVLQVQAFFRRALAMRTSVYLDGLADLAPLPGMLDVIGRDLTGMSVSAAIPSVEADWNALREAGLTRVYVSLDHVDRMDRWHEAELAVSVIAPAPLDLDDADRLVVRLERLSLSERDTVYTLEPHPYPYDPAQRMTLRRAFHHFRSQIRLPEPPAGPVVTHYPILQSVY